jgi:hypothetical protein
MEWRELEEVLLSVPVPARTPAWQRLVNFVEDVVKGKNNLAIELDPGESRYSVRCELCGKRIGILEDYVFKALSATFLHWDCNFTSDDPRMQKALDEAREHRESKEA